MAKYVCRTMDWARKPSGRDRPVEQQGHEVERVDAQYAPKGEADPKAEVRLAQFERIDYLTVDQVGRQDEEEVDADASVVVKVHNAKEGVARIAAVRQQHYGHREPTVSVELGLVPRASVVGKEVF